MTLSSGSPPILTDSATLTGGVPRDRDDHLRSLRWACCAVDTEIVTVSGNGTYTTPTGYTLPTTGTVTGTYQWVATYSGDGNNTAWPAPTGDEPVVVAPANLLMSTTINPSDVTLSNEPLPPVVTDSATLTGSYHATGTITFDLYGPDGVTIVYTDTIRSTEMGRTPRRSPPGPTAGVADVQGPTIGSSATAATPTTTPWPAPSGRVGSGPPGQPRPWHERQPRQRDAVERAPADLDRLGDAFGRVRGDRDDHLRSLRSWAAAPVDTEIVTVSGNGTYTTPTGYTLPTTGTVTGTYQWVASLQRRRQQQRRGQRHGDEPVVVAPANLLLARRPTRRT